MPFSALKMLNASRRERHLVRGRKIESRSFRFLESPPPTPPQGGSVTKPPLEPAALPTARHLLRDAGAHVARRGPARPAGLDGCRGWSGQGPQRGEEKKSRSAPGIRDTTRVQVNCLRPDSRGSTQAGAICQFSKVTGLGLQDFLCSSQPVSVAVATNQLHPPPKKKHTHAHTQKKTRHCGLLWLKPSFNRLHGQSGPFGIDPSQNRSHRSPIDPRPHRAPAVLQRFGLPPLLRAGRPGVSP